MTQDEHKVGRLETEARMMKPEVKLIGEDGNVFNIIGRVVKGLKRAGLKDEAEEFASRAMSSGSYDEVLALTMEYVEVV